MFHLLYLLLISAFLLQSIKCVNVAVEDSQKKYTTTFPLPVIDGNHLRNNTIHTLELLSKEPKDENKPLKMIANFAFLQYINISNFELETIPKFLNLPLAEFIIFEYNDLTKITANSFSNLPNLTILEFSSNIIEEIENNAFGQFLREVYLNCNLLTEVKKSWFENPAVLEILSITNNKISFLDENLLQNFVNLKVVNFANNVITTIGDGAFSGSHYKYISIQGNQISELRSTVFSTSDVTIDLFNIGLNKMNFLAQNLLDKLKVKRFLIFGNPWQCPCLKKITNWLVKSGVSSKMIASDRQKWSENNPVCIYALSFANTCIEVVDNELYTSYLENLGEIETRRYC